MRLIHTVMAACLTLALAAAPPVAIANDAHHPQSAKQKKPKKTKPAKKATKSSEAVLFGQG